MPQAPADVISGLYEAFGRGDIPAILAMVDEQDRLGHAAENLPHGGHFQGRDAVGRSSKGSARTWEGLHLELEDMISGGERVIALARSMAASGRPARCRATPRRTRGPCVTALPFASMSTWTAPLTLPSSARCHTLTRF